ncbi:hypothetical protein BS47DRAFT_1370574 [Hydnum rufescens UP504]|uniref:tRNA-5-taurinomethyluridine 2-sulfurtransferase n=1 Tax=Hydnum rufescens UP504 TaxID=1448309 RepID=A0A9P6B8Y1_9AGAM|nr:hypothetical protein BS47DRAFT_1370574 [Hydnum rufescens UP504]
MSGGVDSSLAARLLAEKDYNLRAVYMRNWDRRDELASDTGCEWEKDWEDVQRVCRHLDIPCEMIDLSQQYWTRVFEPALEEWAGGLLRILTEIKFGALMDRVISSPSQEWLATGHYARIFWDETFPVSRPRLMRARDKAKDQSYYLSSVTESRLRMALFPIGHLTKPEVRELARNYGLPTASRSESMGICFVGERGHFDKFLSQYIPSKPGNIVDLHGKILGRHNGLHSYTIGQGAKLGGQKRKTFVARKNIATNEVVVVDRGDHPALMSSALTVCNWHWIWPDRIPPEVDTDEGFNAKVQIRHRMRASEASVRRTGEGKYELKFREPQHAATPGQIAAIWDGDCCLGCGRIESSVCLYYSN